MEPWIKFLVKNSAPPRGHFPGGGGTQKFIQVLEKNNSYLLASHVIQPRQWSCQGWRYNTLWETSTLTLYHTGCRSFIVYNGILLWPRMWQEAQSTPDIADCLPKCHVVSEWTAPAWLLYGFCGQYLSKHMCKPCELCISFISSETPQQTQPSVVRMRWTNRPSFKYLLSTVRCPAMLRMTDVGINDAPDVVLVTVATGFTIWLVGGTLLQTE